VVPERGSSRRVRKKRPPFRRKKSCRIKKKGSFSFPGGVRHPLEKKENPRIFVRERGAKQKKTGVFQPCPSGRGKGFSGGREGGPGEVEKGPKVSGVELKKKSCN